MKHLASYIDTVLERQDIQYQIKKKISVCIEDVIHILITPESIELDGNTIKCIVSSVIRMYIFENQTKINKKLQEQKIPYSI